MEPHYPGQKLALIRRIILLMSSLAFLFGTHSAFAASSHCDSTENIKALLAKEGHVIVARMNKQIYSVEKELWTYEATFVTATRDLKQWYLVKAPTPLDQPPAELCIVIRGINLEINDYRYDHEPTVTRYKFDPEKVAQACADPSVKGGCGELNERIQHLSKEYSAGIALQGIAGNLLATFIAAPSGEREYRVLATGSDGGAIITARGENFMFSPQILPSLPKQ